MTRMLSFRSLNLASLTTATLPFLLALASLPASVQGQGDPAALQPVNNSNPRRSWTPWTPKPRYDLEDLPVYYMGTDGSGSNTSAQDQTGWNTCAPNTWNQESRCQTAWINSLEDFCIYGPPEVGTIGDTEREAVAYCTTNKHGTRLIPDGTITGAHFVKTSNYVQVTGVGDFTKINIPFGDDGGEMDSHGMDDLSNPIGGIYYTTANPATNGQPWFVSEWTNFMSYNQFCLRACWGDRAGQRCQHIYDIMGCQWNMPANYDAGVFESCDGSLAELQGIYGGSTWQQGTEPTPSAHPAPRSSNCRSVSTLSHGLLAAADITNSAGGPTSTSSSSSSSSSTVSTSVSRSSTSSTSRSGSTGNGNAAYSPAQANSGAFALVAVVAVAAIFGGAAVL